MENDIVAAANAGQWILVAALAIGILVRLVKSDNKFPIDIPPRLRVWLALGLGVISGILMKVASGMTWKASIVAGLASSVTAILGQNVVIDSIRGGKEIPVPGLMKGPPAVDPDSPPGVDLPQGAVSPPTPSDPAGAPTKPNKLPTIPPLTVVALSFFAGFMGCAMFESNKPIIRGALDVVSYACVLQHALDYDNATIAKMCAIDEALRPALDELLKQHRDGVQRAKARPDTVPAPMPSSVPCTRLPPTSEVYPYPSTSVAPSASLSVAPKSSASVAPSASASVKK